MNWHWEESQGKTFYRTASEFTKVYLRRYAENFKQQSMTNGLMLTDRAMRRFKLFQEAIDDIHDYVNGKDVSEIIYKGRK